MDTSGVQNPTIEERAVGGSRRRYRTVEEKRRIVKESLKPGASVAVVARRFDVNANQVFTWRRQLQRGELAGKRAAAREARLLPVAVHDECAQRAQHLPSAASEAVRTDRIEIEFAGGRRLCIQGRADPDTLSAVIRELSRR